MIQKIRVAGYVKLAKLWERSRTQALEYHHQYYEKKYADSELFELFDVYVDITGKKEICNRPEMLRIIRDCMLGRVDCIAAQTRGYLAANTAEFCYLIKYLFDMGRRIDLVTEDELYNIDTFTNADRQREALYQMATNLINLNPADYEHWKENIRQGMNKLSDI